MFVTLLLEGHFDTGHVVVTTGVANTLPHGEVAEALMRHVSCDWGDLDEQDWKQNDDALEGGGRLLSRYRTKSGTLFWIITEHDRSVTTVLLPLEH